MRFIHTPKRRSVVLIVLAVLTSACSNDRYLFMEKAQLTQLQQQVDQHQHQLARLMAENQRQIEQLEHAQALRHQSVMHSLEQQTESIQALEGSDKRYTSPYRPAFTASGEQTRQHQGKQIVGEVEPVFLAIPGVVYSARIDSGATTSSLDASNITRFERDGETWVRFDIRHPDSETLITVERALVRTARILQADSQTPEERPVVRLPFVLGNHRQSAEFTLNDREHLTYPLLIGRNVLKDVMLIDVGQTHMTRLPEALTQQEAP